MFCDHRYKADLTRIGDRILSDIDDSFDFITGHYSLACRTLHLWPAPFSDFSFALL